MDRETFVSLRAKLGKTQKSLAELLGVSLKAVQSYEQGWRSIPIHVERQLFFLVVKVRIADRGLVVDEAPRFSFLWGEMALRRDEDI